MSLDKREVEGREQSFEALGTRLRELEYLCGLNDTSDDLLESAQPIIELGLVAENIEVDTGRDEGVGEMSTFDFVQKLKNTNTMRKTDSDLKKFTSFLNTIGEMRKPEEIPVEEMDLHLARFFMNAKKSNGDEYEPDTLKSIQGSVNRYFSDKNLNINIITDKGFKHSRDVLASKRKLLRQLGKGNRENRAEPLTAEEIDLLYQKNLLGTGNPRSLINVLYLNNTMHFGMRSRTEHANLRWGDVTVKETSTGEEYLEYTERATKTRSGITSDCRNFAPKMFEDKGNPRCPVFAYKEFAKRRPQAMNKPESPFYIGISRNTDRAWFVNQPMGKNTLGNIVKSMCEAGSIQGRKVNHSARKTAISSLVHAGVPPTLIQQLSGHKNVNSINNYSTASYDQQRNMSSILTNYSSSSENCLKQPVTAAESTTSYTSPQLCPVTATECTTKETSSLLCPVEAADCLPVPFSPIASDADIIHQTLNEITSFEEKTMMEPINKQRLVGNFTGAHISGNVIFNFCSKSPKPLKRRRVIYSDSDSD